MTYLHCLHYGVHVRNEKLERIMKYIYAALVATLMFAGTSFAETINVPGDYTTIQGAIDASSDGDVIAIAAGTYYENNLHTFSYSITIQGTLNKDGSLATTINANGGGSVFFFEYGGVSGTEIKDLVITGGSSSNGGGIYCRDSSPIISNCTITGNEANYGGGIYCWDSNPTITDCTISGNTANWGVGIYCNSNSSPTITDCTIESNTANYGGGIYCHNNSNPTISNCTISGNTANYDGGGGIYCWNSNPTITDCTIEGNTSTFSGGGIYCTSGSNPTISGCTITGNTANYGGGIYCYASNPTISDSEICGNEPDQIYGPWTDGGWNTVVDDCIPSGACCIGSGCSVTTEPNCIAAGGTYQGDYSDCNRVRDENMPVGATKTLGCKLRAGKF